MELKASTRFAGIVLAAAVAIPVWLTAQEAKAKHHHYQPVNIGTFGGPSSYYDTLSLSDRFPGFADPDGFARVINQNGLMVGWADTSEPAPDMSYCLEPGYDCYVAHAFQWENGALTDLGSLPGGASSVAMWVNSRGESVGFAQNGQVDPITGFPELHAVYWKNGQISDLGTLGGNQSFALSVGDGGQITGGALNAVPDTYSFYDLFFQGSSAGTQTRGFVWKNGFMHDIGTLGGPDAFPALINRRGQIAGFSYINSIPNSDDGLPTFDPFLWDPHRGMKDLGNFGGDQTASVNGLNDRGEVVGGLWLPGGNQIHPFVWDGSRLIDMIAPPFGGPGNGEASWINDAGEVVGLAGIPRFCPVGSAAAGPIQHAFLWKDGLMEDLGSLPGSPNSEGDSINSRAQIVGISWNCDYAFTPVLWEDNSVVDLNRLVPPDSTFLFYASSITDQGEIAALGLLPNGDLQAEMLIPCDENHPGVEGCDYNMVDAATAANSAPPRYVPSATQRLHQRSNRVYFPGLGASARK
jgi:probable HAF family extracellular repeat protein